MGVNQEIQDDVKPHLLTYIMKESANESASVGATWETLSRS